MEHCERTGQEMKVIVTQNELAELLEARVADGSKLVVMDCRFWLMEPERGLASYVEGHIPGAIFLDLNQDLSSPVQEHGGRHPLPDPEKLASRLTAAGVTRTSPIVAYDDQGGSGASRLWWVLQWMGHEGDVRLLDGGIGAWKAAALPIGQGVEVAQAASERYVPQLQPQLVASMADVKSKLGARNVVLIDSRDSQRYRGEVEPIDRAAGHIPGAINQPWQGNLDAEGHWKSADAQRARWSDVIGDAEEIIVYCGSGVTACPNLLGLWQSGYRHAKLYAGSWSDWSSYEENPVATGEE